MVVAFDGLQPAQVTPRLMPNLAALAGQGVTFGRHHPSFPTVTRSNVATIVTGRYPGGHGIAANTLVMREFDPDHTFSVMEPELTRLARETGRVLLCKTLADVLSRHGREYVAVGIGTSGNAYLHNPNADISGGATIHPDFCLPSMLHEEVMGRFGRWPPKTIPNKARMDHALRIMSEYVLPDRDPAVSLIWLSEPDDSQHAGGVGSALGESALLAADECLGRLLEWLEETGRRSRTDVMVVSDHGYSTITAVHDIEGLISDAGFPLGGRPGGVIVVPNGGAVLFYVHRSDRATADKLAEWLMGQPWCGVLLASEAVAGLRGTLPAALVRYEGAHVPDLAMSLAWDSEPNEAGVVGHVYSSSGSPGLGTHGSMSRQEMRCVLLASGPSFKRGVSLQTPSGNVDLAPTILRVLGMPGADAMEGRVLTEALAHNPHLDSTLLTTEVHRAERDVGMGVYRQQVTISSIGTTAYIDEGHGCIHKRENHVDE